MKKSILFLFFFALCFTQIACTQTKTGKINTNVKKQINQLLLSYYEVKDALVATDGKTAKTKAGEVLKSLAKVEVANLSAEQQKIYAPLSEKIKFDAEHINETEDVEHQRQHFEDLSKNLYALVTTFKANTATAYQQFCPMAFDDKGAFWLSDKKEIRNPYFGNKMLKCGSVKSEF